MIQQHNDYQIDDSRERFKLSLAQKWLATTYWWRDTITTEGFNRACEHSAFLIGAYQGDEQVACARVVSDKTRFAWLADVYVAPEHRKRGLAKAIARYVVEHPDCRTITRFLLVTRDAHEIYASVGFQPLPDPEHFMQFRREDTRAIGWLRG